MATFTMVLLSGSTYGKMIPVVATATTGTTIHATGTSATILDKVYLWAVNTDTSPHKLTIEFGATATGDQIEVTIPAESGLFVVVDGLVLAGSGAAASTITAFADSASKINLGGYVLRYTP